MIEEPSKCCAKGCGSSEAPKPQVPRSCGDRVYERVARNSYPSTLEINYCPSSSFPRRPVRIIALLPEIKSGRRGNLWIDLRQTTRSWWWMTRLSLASSSSKRWRRGRIRCCSRRADGSPGLFRRHSPSIVLTDWMMPDFSGLELCERIRAEAQREYVYIVMLSAKTEKDTS